MAPTNRCDASDGAIVWHGPRAARAVRALRRWWGAPRPRASPTLVVWATWGVMSLLNVVYVATYASRIPYQDDWNLVPVVTGNWRMSASWLWEQYHEHRIPLPKLLYVGLVRAAGYDVRAAVLFNAVALSLISAAMIAAARRMRGRLSYCDAFFPLALLHWGQGRNLAEGFTINLVLPAVLGGVVLAVVSGCRRGQSLRACTVVGACLLLLPLCGAVGLLMVGPMALWLLYCARHYRREGRPAAGAAVALLGVAALALTGLYFVGYESKHAEPPGAWPVVRTTLQFVSASLGVGGRLAWPFSAIGVVGLGVATMALLARAWRRRIDRARVFGLLMFGCSLALLAAGIGWGRAFLSDAAGFANRYVTFAAPILCFAYFTWERYSRGTARAVVTMGLLVLVSLLVGFNVEEGRRIGARGLEPRVALAQCMRAGMPRDWLAEEFCDVHGVRREHLAMYLDMLCRRGVAPFRALVREVPPVDEVSLAATPQSTNEMIWSGASGHGSGRDPYAIFQLDRPRFVYGIRLRFRVRPSGGGAVNTQVFWRDGRRGEDFVETERNVWLQPPGDGAETTRTVRVWNTIDAFRIDPAMQPCEIDVAQISLVGPPEGRIAVGQGVGQRR